LKTGDWERQVRWESFIEAGNTVRLTLKPVQAIGAVIRPDRDTLQKAWESRARDDS